MDAQRSKRRVALIAVYVLMAAGGLWQILGVLQKVRQMMAAPLLMFLTLWAVGETTQAMKDQVDGKRRVRLFLGWVLLVALLSFGIEWLGVKSGAIFGAYHYGPVLQPQINGVPIAIGLAWLLSVMGAMRIAQQILGNQAESRVVFTMTSIALLVLFDYLLERAAVELGYWSWQDESVPLQNYLAWMLIGGFFILLAQGKTLARSHWPMTVGHLYIAQLLYFLLVGLKKYFYF